MNKELETLKNINSLNKIFDIAVHQGNKLVDIRTDYETVKSAIEELEQYRKCIDLKQAEYISTHKMSVMDTETFVQITQRIEKLEKAFEIFKKTYVLLILQISDDYEDFVYNIGDELFINEEEYNFLKEMIENGR